MRRLLTVGLVGFGVAVIVMGVFLIRIRQQPLTRARLLFVSSRDGSDEIWRMWDDGSHLEQLTDSPNGIKLRIRPSPDKRYIAFVSNDEGSPEIYLADANAKNSRRLTNMSYTTEPYWSLDSTTLFFYILDEGLTSLYSVTTDGGFYWRDESIRDVPYYTIYFPELSPDGEWVVLQGARDRNFDILLTSVGGDTMVHLTSSPAYDGYPSWSPDGQAVVFVSDRIDGRQYNIFKIELDWACLEDDSCMLASQPQQLTPSLENVDFYEPHWYRDWIVFWGSNRLSNEYTIYKMRPDGSDLQAITPAGTDVAPIWQPIVEFSWQPIEVVMVGLACLLMCWLSNLRNV